MKVVVVEDEIRIREGLCKLIQKMFPEMEIAGTAENGQAGIECIETYMPDLVITDIKMPVMERAGKGAISESDRPDCIFRVFLRSAGSTAGRTGLPDQTDCRAGICSGDRKNPTDV